MKDKEFLGNAYDYFKELVANDVPMEESFYIVVKQIIEEVGEAIYEQGYKDAFVLVNNFSKKVIDDVEKDSTDGKSYN